MVESLIGPITPGAVGHSVDLAQPDHAANNLPNVVPSAVSRHPGDLPPGEGHFVALPAPVGGRPAPERQRRPDRTRRPSAARPLNE